MNKEDLIQKYESLEGVWDANGAEIARQCFLRDLEQLNEIDTKKVTVPQSVADWITYCKDKEATLGYALFCPEQARDEEVYEWVTESTKNQELFAHAWLDGYTVEKEKRYTIKVKGNLGQYLGKYYLNNVELTPQFIRTQKSEPSIFTKEELERTGFGWVFDCEGIEVKEVE